MFSLWSTQWNWDYELEIFLNIFFGFVFSALTFFLSELQFCYHFFFSVEILFTSILINFPKNHCWYMIQCFCCLLPLISPVSQLIHIQHRFFMLLFFGNFHHVRHTFVLSWKEGKVFPFLNYLLFFIRFFFSSDNSPSLARSSFVLFIISRILIHHQEFHSWASHSFRSLSHR